MFLLGLPGLIDDTKGWAKWIESAANWLEQHTSITEILPRPDWIPYALMSLGIALVVPWGWVHKKLSLAANELPRLKYRALFSIRRIMATNEWINMDSALSVLRQSPWARARWAMNSPKKSLLDLVQPGHDPSEKSRRSMFADWCAKALAQFEKETTGGARKDKGKLNNEYNENDLRAWLDERYNSELSMEFGSP